MAVALDSLNESFMRAVGSCDFDQTKKDLEAGADVNVLKGSQLIYSSRFRLLLTSEYRMLTLLARKGFNIADAVPNQCPSFYVFYNRTPANYPTFEERLLDRWEKQSWFLQKWRAEVPLFKERVRNVTKLIKEETDNPLRIQKLTDTLLCMPKVLITLISEYACEIPWEDRENLDYSKLRHMIGSMLCCNNIFIDKVTGKARIPLPDDEAGMNHIFWHIYDYYSA